MSIVWYTSGEILTTGWPSNFNLLLLLIFNIVIIIVVVIIAVY